jgi:exosortase A-associated hydrolase 2
LAEEMNKSRRMVAMQSRALAVAGCAVLRADLMGCGDSAGDFGDAGWDAWVDDVVDACALARSRCRDTWPDVTPPPLWLWGQRSGCLLAAAAAKRASLDGGFLFWQPVSSGRQALNQFMRLKSMGALQPGVARGDVDDLRRDLAEGRTIDVAGYRLSSSLAHGLERALLEPAASAGLPVHWLEVSPHEGAGLLPASAAVIERWRSAGHPVTAQVVGGPSFWSTVEIEDAPALVDATRRALTETVAV